MQARRGNSMEVIEKGVKIVETAGSNPKPFLRAFKKAVTRRFHGDFGRNWRLITVRVLFFA